MTRRLDTRFVRLAALAMLAMPLAGCLGSEEFQRGYMIDQRALGQVTRGMSAEKVLETLGTPSTVSTVGTTPATSVTSSPRDIGLSDVPVSPMATANASRIKRKTDVRRCFMNPFQA